MSHNLPKRCVMSNSDVVVKPLNPNFPNYVTYVISTSCAENSLFTYNMLLL